MLVLTANVSQLSQTHYFWCQLRVPRQISVPSSHEKPAYRYFKKSMSGIKMWYLREDYQGLCKL